MKCIQYRQTIQIRRNQGFTLIELLVVIIILGTLSTIALPSFIGQVGKAREVDAKNNLGTIARAQQAYHFEKRRFADDINNLNIAGLGSSNYYNFPNPSVADSAIVKHQAIAIKPTIDLIRNYAAGVYHASDKFEISFCQSIAINQAVDVGNTFNANCTNSGIKIK